MATTLREGSSLLLWRRQITAVHPTLAPVRLPRPDDLSAAALLRGEVELPNALGEHIEEGELAVEDPTMAARLLEVARRFGGWLPGFVDEEAERLQAVAAAHARRRINAPPRIARPTLPSSTVRRARAIAELGCAKIYVEDDIDGLGLLLARSVADGDAARVLICEPEPGRRAWLEAEAERAGVADGVAFCDTPPAAGEHELDLACLSLGPPGHSGAALHRAASLVGAQGRVAATFRPPWDSGLLDQIEAFGFTLDRHLREVDHEVLPGGFAVNNVGDLVLLTAPAELPAAPASTDDEAEGDLRAQPYFWVEFDDLAGDKLEGSVIDRLADCIAGQSPLAEDMRTVSRDGERQVLSWYDVEGNGLTAELTKKGKHILICLMPYSLDLEYVATCATMHTLGDDFTHMRPRLSVRYGKESIVG